MRCSITLCLFAKRAQITFGAIAKGNLLLYEYFNKSKETNFLTLRKLFWEAKHILYYSTNQQKFLI
jgi:hypothetical protein